VFIADTLKQLLILLSDGEFHSGTELSQLLGISRTTIWKHLHSLQKLGIEYVAVTGKGYRLIQKMQLLDSARIQQSLNNHSLAGLQRLEVHDVLDSTNGYLMQLARELDVSAYVCAAEHQTAGRGRRGRQWVSPYGHNLYFSVLWRYAEDPSCLNGLSLAIGVAVMRVLKALGLDDVGLKWPNDIYYQQRKLGGILLEVSGESSGPCHVVVGLGLNLSLSTKQAKSINQPWTDLQQVSGANLDRNLLLSSLINEIFAVLPDYTQTGLTHYLDEWRSYDVVQSQVVTLEVGAQSIEAVVEGIDDQGLLLVTDLQGQQRRYASGEISLKLA